MNLTGLIIGGAAFILIGVFHPLVIKSEYYFGKRVWIVFLLAGLGAVGGSFFISQVYVSGILGIFGFSALWSIKEIFEQEERVESGRFPYHPTKTHHAHIREKFAARDAEKDS